MLLHIILCILGISFSFLVAYGFEGCARRAFGSNSHVCVCNQTYCDWLEFDWQSKDRLVQIQSSLSGKRFEVEKLQERNNSFELYTNSLLEPTTKIDGIFVNSSNTRQSILGFGAAFTDASVINIDSLPQGLADALLESYFGKKGLQYSLARVPIAGTDFSNRTYSYDDTTAPDYELKHWSLADEDTKLKVPLIKKADKLAAQSNGRKLRLLASPWSPPKWMKEGDSFARGHLKDDERVYRAYAEYLMRFFDAYKELGVDFWGATLQNEPISAYFPFYWFNSLQFSQSEQLKFINGYLGPALELRKYNKTNFKLFIGDDQIGLLDLQIPGLLANSELRKHVSGVAFHWYLNGIVPYSQLSNLYAKISDKIDYLLMSEACTGSMPSSRGVKLGSWQRGEQYAQDIIDDLNRFTSAWIDWNMALDMKGGPNWAGNYVDAPIVVNKGSGEFYKQPMFYALAHFSKFIKAEDRVVESRVSGRSRLKALSTISSKSNVVILVVLNSNKQAVRRIPITVRVNDTSWLRFNAELDSNSINTFVIGLSK